MQAKDSHQAAFLSGLLTKNGAWASGHGKRLSGSSIKWKPRLAAEMWLFWYGFMTISISLPSGREGLPSGVGQDGEAYQV
jgi:hypothetical protein